MFATIESIDLPPKFGGEGNTRLSSEISWITDVDTMESANFGFSSDTASIGTPESIRRIIGDQPRGISTSRRLALHEIISPSIESQPF